METYLVEVHESGDIHWKNPKTCQLHREDGPAVEGDDGHKEWWLNGKRHREDGPAIEQANGSKVWYLNGKLHREDGPAVELADGTKEWWVRDSLHREDGPAIERADGTKEWWLMLNREKLTEDEFYAKTKPATLTIDGKTIELSKETVDALKSIL